jgi:hypothetical protein
MKPILAIALIAFIFSISCSRDDFFIDPDNLIIGTWTYSENLDDILVFDRNNEFINNQCFRFESDGTLTERANSGFCGTPPVSYADYRGNWIPVNDTLIMVRVDSWNGWTEFKLDIESLGPGHLKTRIVYDQ